MGRESRSGERGDFSLAGVRAENLGGSRFQRGEPVLVHAELLHAGGAKLAPLVCLAEAGVLLQQMLGELRDGNQGAEGRIRKPRRQMDLMVMAHRLADILRQPP